MPSGVVLTPTTLPLNPSASYNVLMPEKPENGDDGLKGVRTNLTQRQLEYVDSVWSRGLACSRSDAVRYIINQAMEKGIIKTIEG